MAGPAATDRLKAAIEGFITRIVSKYDYSGAYTYTVVTQNSDGTLELKPDRPDLIPGLSNVKISYGNPGEVATVAQGARCRVMFENNDPSRPFVLGWENGGLNTLAFAGGAQPVARLGDVVQSGGPGTTVSFTGPGPFLVPGVPYLISFSPIPQPQAPLFGAIASGSSKVSSS